MHIGTKSVLFGAHCFFLHPFFVARAWWNLYGFPFDVRLWVAFFVHDLGYWGKPNMDGPEGETHPELGARIMGLLFDDPAAACAWCRLSHRSNPYCPQCAAKRTQWHDFSLYHSRYYAKPKRGALSRLCFADKLSFCYTPAWLYLPMVTATGEIREYLKMAQKADSAHWTPTGNDKRVWHVALKAYMRAWVEEHKDGATDTWTDSDRHAKNETEVWK